jgi:peptidoglycan/xylan/chitin deacetylase (PgdA/CDA1 family)
VTDRVGSATALPVLMYHSIGGPMPPGLEQLSVPPALLHEQLMALREAGYELLGLTEALAAAVQGRRVVAVTVDDGFVDFVDHGLATLAAVGATATLYVPSRAIGGSATWIRGGARPLPVVDDLQIGEVVAAGVEIGSHGAEHVPMDVLRPAEAARHLEESRDRLAQASGRPVSSMCYPHGYSSRALRRLVAGAGYANACAIGHRRHQLTSDPYAVQRLLVGPQHDPAGVLRLAAHGPSPWLPAAKRALGPAWRLARGVALRRGRTWT